MNRKQVEEYDIGKLGFICLTNTYPMGEDDYKTRLIYKIPNKGLRMKAFINIDQAMNYVSDLVDVLGLDLDEAFNAFESFAMDNSSIEYRVSNLKTKTAYSLGISFLENNLSRIEYERLENYEGTKISILDESMIK